MRLSRLTTIIALSMLVSIDLRAQDAASGLPQIALMPWRIFAIDSEVAAHAKSDLRAERQKLAATWLSQPQTLADYLGDNMKQPIMRRQMSQQIMVGQHQASNNTTRSLLIEPIWCSVGDQYVVALTAADLKLDHYLAIAHRRIQRAPWNDRRQPDDLRAGLAAMMLELSTELASKLANPTDTERSPETLRVGLRLGQETTRHDIGSSLCLNLLLAETLYPTTRIIHTLGNEALTHLRDQLAPTQRPLRSSRNIILAWQHQAGPQPRQPLRLPFTYQLQLRFNESVFGSPLGSQQLQAAVQIAATDKQLRLTPPPTIHDFLTRQSQALAPQDLPQVAKIRGAWVYLDRGRAWGLNMNDRLISNDGNGPIYGHVVGFYGPDLKIKSPRGFAVDEGAIVFIRKGQRLTAAGQNFAFDPQTYPTPWPPRAK